ncbi:MAG: bifunctional phosphoribosylaminoimidazolecarboxamide formyltransferase/IMP cyclohydrolase [Thermonemataceae bacterium]|nr:bifunctional phosphoribosylaminoimidazolecarboxamide formyltransferase/IMP cyclohydrolase [Thermonemataceae bacterium]
MQIQSALISVFYKDGLDKIAQNLAQKGVKIYSTGGTQKFLEDLGIPVIAAEDLTAYPSILGGRVKTLHPKVFGGILGRRAEQQDKTEMDKFAIPTIDLVIVDLYPFEETLAKGASSEEIIEKIDIGGISLIRAAAKNFQDVVIIPSKNDYDFLLNILENQNATSTLEQRKYLATKAFELSSHYDTAIFKYFNTQTQASTSFKESILESKTLRYGENPHQKGFYFGNLNEIFEQLNGKELSYNNLLDVESAVSLIEEFPATQTACAIIKHTNACGCAFAENPKDAYLKALSADPVSAFGGIIILNQAIDMATAQELDKLFFEVLIAPFYEAEALDLLKKKKNRIILLKKSIIKNNWQFRSLLNGVLVQEKDLKTEIVEDLKVVTQKSPTESEQKAMLFAATIAKHTKSNTIVLANETQLLASGTGQTSRVDALNQAIAKAQSFGFSLQGAVMASDAFFPFPDCVEIAGNVGITAVMQPGGSIKDQDSIDYCDKHNLAMVFTGIRHFKH